MKLLSKRAYEQPLWRGYMPLQQYKGKHENVAGAWTWMEQMLPQMGKWDPSKIYHEVYNHLTASLEAAEDLGKIAAENGDHDLAKLCAKEAKRIRTSRAKWENGSCSQMPGLGKRDLRSPIQGMSHIQAVKKFEEGGFAGPNESFAEEMIRQCLLHHATKMLMRAEGYFSEPPPAQISNVPAGEADLPDVRPEKY